MTNVKRHRVVLAGLLAGVVSSLIWLPVLFTFRRDFETQLSSLGLSIQLTPRMLLNGIIAFPAMGTLAVWLYAAIQPSYGRGPAAAAIAASPFG